MTKQALERSKQEKTRLWEKFNETKVMLQRANETLDLIRSNSSPVHNAKRQRYEDLGVNLNDVMSTTKLCTEEVASPLQSFHPTRYKIQIVWSQSTAVVEMQG